MKKVESGVLLMALFFIGLIGFVVCLIMLIIQAIRKKSKKLVGILTAVFFVVGIIGMITAMNTPAVEIVKADYKKIMAGELNGKLVDLTGDIEDIRKDGDLYYITIRTSDGVYEAVTTDNVAGTFPQVGDKNVKMYVTPDYTEDGSLVITIISFRK